MSQNPTQNNLPQTQPTNAGNLVRQRPLNNNSNANYNVYMSSSNPFSNNHRIINPQVPQMRQNPQNPNLLTSRMLTQAQIKPTNVSLDSLVQARPHNNLTTQETLTESINSQAVGMSVNSISQVQPAVNNSNNNQPANNPMVQAGQSINNSAIQTIILLIPL